MHTFVNTSAVSSCFHHIAKASSKEEQSEGGEQKREEKKREAIRFTCGFHKVKNPRKLAGYVRLDGDAAEACGDARAAGIAAAEAA
jgi:hypothetical protein